MHDFGKLTAQKKTFTIPGEPGWPLIGENNEPVLDADGLPVMVGKTDPTVINVLAFFDASETEWHDLYNAVPRFDFYVALDEDDCVISMESDPESSQIAGVRILGISTAEAGGFTRGPGGTVYGMKWSGTQIVNPVDLMSPEEKRAAMQPLTPRQFRDALIDNDILPDDVTAVINQIADPKARAKALNAWEYPTQFLRTDQLLDQIGVSFNLTPEAIDAMWIAATGP